MINVSDAFKQLLNDGHNNYLTYVDITLSDGTKLSLGNSEIWDSGVEISDSVSSDNSFDVGAAIVNSAKIVINNIYDTYSDYDFFNAEAVTYVGLKLPDGTTERIRKGTFFVDDPKYNGAIITLNCLDNMSKFDRPYSESTLQYPATLNQIIRDACSVCGVTLQTYNFPHDDYVVKERPEDEATTFGEVIQWAAQIACCFCRCDVYGRLELKWYNQEALENHSMLSGGDFKDSFEDTVSGGAMNPWTTGEEINAGDFSVTNEIHHIYSLSSLSLSTDDVVITGIRVSVKASDDSENEIAVTQAGKDGYVISIEGNELINIGDGAIVAGWIGEKLIGFRFRKASISHVSNPTIEAGDVAMLTDTKGRVYDIVISSTTFNSNGSYQKTESSAVDPIRNSATRFSESTKNYVDYRKEIQKERTEREKALEELGKRLEASTGVFTTIEEQPDGSNIYYLHNKPSLDDSDIVWKMTAEAWGVSTDGGKTWNAGMTVDGDTIVRILTATGVNADWIKTGALQISDTDGNIIFLADMDTKQLIISGDYISIGDQSATDLINQANKNANEALEEVKKAKGFNVILSNEYAGISVDNDGNYTEFPETKTIAYAFMGSQDITDDCSFSVQKSAGVTGSWNADTHTYTVTGLSTDSGWVDITATYMTILTAVKRFNLSKIKGGKPGTPGDPGTPGRTYYIQPSRTALKQTESHSISPGYIDFNAYYRDGTNASRVAYSGRFKIEEQSSAGTWTTIYTSAANETSVRHILYYVLQDTDGNFIGDADGYAFGGWRDIAQIRVSLYAAGGTTQLIDQQTIPVVKDGEKGEDGTALTPDEVFNILTNNGEIQGLYKIGDKIYFNAEYIKSGTIIADLIKGGILNLGGVSNENGVLVMRNASGQEIGRWDKDGLVVNSGAISANAISGGALDLGGASNGNGILRIFNASGTQVGYINNTGVHFSQGEVSANVIKGGYLDLGGGSNGDGVLRIFDASGSQIGYINNTGVHFNKGTFSGSLSAATGTFKGELQAATGTFKGELQAATGTFTGSLSASCIKGGTLTLGGASNGNGLLQIRDASGNDIGHISNTGVYFNKGQISANVLKGGYLDLGGTSNGDGVLRIFNASGEQTGYINNTGVHFNEGTFGGSLSAATGTFKGELQAATGTFKGNLSAAGGTFKGDLQAAGGTFSGSLQAARGTFSGSITVGGDSSGIINIKNSNNVTIGTISESGVILNGSSGNPYFIVNSSSGNTKVSISGSGVRCFNGTSSYITMEGGTIPYLSILDSNGNSTSVRGTSISTDGSLSIGGISSFGGYATFEQSIVANSSITCKGTLTVSGYKNRLVETDNYDERLLYSYEMPSPMFGDIGEATTDENGECYLFLDDIFQETVTTSIEYQVFLQKEGQGDIWVEEKAERYFIVKGTPNLKFSWEIKAKQREYEYERLETYNTFPEIREPNYEEEANKYVDEIIHDYENSTFDVLKYYAELEEAA